MLKIAVCEDEKVQTQLILNLLNKWDSNNINIQSFVSAENFYFEWIGNQDFYILLLDIQMSGEDGISLAKKIRKEDENIIIIFVTGLEEYIAEGYEVNAFNYLLKPINERKFYECLDKAKLRLSKYKAQKYIILTTNDGIFKVEEDSIIKIESFSHKIVVSTLDNTYEISKSLSVLEKELDKSTFFRCHRSIIVNLKHIEKIQDKKVYLTNSYIVFVTILLYLKMVK